MASIEDETVDESTVECTGEEADQQSEESAPPESPNVNIYIGKVRQQQKQQAKEECNNYDIFLHKFLEDYEAESREESENCLLQLELAESEVQTLVRRFKTGMLLLFFQSFLCDSRKCIICLQWSNQISHQFS